MECLVYAIFVLGLTALWVYMLRNRSFTFLAYAMFFPGATAVVWSLLKGSLLEFLYEICGLTQVFRTLLFSVVSVGCVYVIVNGCVQVSLALGWAQKVEQPPGARAIHEHNKNYLPGFLRAAGEEIGWRCFLLPCLLQSYSPFVALSISGVIWGLFHVPVMILLVSITKPERPYVTIAVQSVACVFAAFTHGWVAMKAGFTLWPPSIMHWFWNVYNPVTLGSIYTNTPGLYKGTQWKINGEGLMGCIVMAPFVAMIVWELSVGERRELLVLY